MRRRYGSLTVVEVVGKKKDRNNFMRTVVCAKCRCGNTIEVFLHRLQGKKSAKSCGCRKYKNTTHKLSKHPLYAVWSSMKRRCANKGDKDYGGRGITVCVLWQRSFRAFYNWCLKNGYATGLELDRRNNDLGYRPGNCRFVTHQVNCQNRRKPYRRHYPELPQEELDKIEYHAPETQNYF